MKKNVKSVARSAKGQKARCGVVVALPGISRKKRRMGRIGTVPRHFVQRNDS